MIWLFYIFFVIGLMLMFSSSIYIFVLEIRKSRQYSRRIDRGLVDTNPLISNKLLLDFSNLLKSTLGDWASKHMHLILSLQFLLALSIYITTLNQRNILFSIGASLSISMLPYVLLILRLHTLRVQSSYEGEFFITELINQYKLNHFNMVEAIDSTVVHLKDSPRTRKLLFILSIRIKSYRDRGELEEILEEFTYSINTQWSRMVSNNLLLSIEDGFEVTSGLMDIQQELKRAKSAYEKSSRNTTEGFAIVKVFIPILYLFTIYLSIHFFDFTIDKFLHYQFRTPGGFKLLLVNVMLYAFNVVLMILFQKRKFDIT